MKKILSILTPVSLIIISSCATSKSPAQFYSMFPTLTKSTYVDKNKIETLVENKQCRLITENKQYSAPVAGSVKGDMKKGAKGVDELIQLEGGNSYVLKNFNWKNFDSWGSTQLHLEFDIYDCNQ